MRRGDWLAYFLFSKFPVSLGDLRGVIRIIESVLLEEVAHKVQK